MKANSRHAAALIEALVALAAASVLMGTITWQVLANRRLVEHRQHQQQSQWLARAGVELAADRLLSGAGEYRGENLSPVPKSELKIAVHPEPGKKGVYRVVSEARYPTDIKESVARSETRRLRRMLDGDRVRVEVVVDGPARE